MPKHTDSIALFHLLLNLLQEFHLHKTRTAFQLTEARGFVDDLDLIALSQLAENLGVQIRLRPDVQKTGYLVHNIAPFLLATLALTLCH